MQQGREAKGVTIKTRVRAFLLAAWLSAAMPFHAVADFPVGRVLTVSIESVDPAANQIIFKSVRTGESFTAQWTKTTRFSRGGWKRFGPEIVQEGARAEVLYSTPTFGEPFVARVIVLAPTPFVGSRK